MTRFKELRDILEGARYFKVVCGAGNEDPVEVRLLSLVYTLAGASGIDVSANVDVVRAAKDGVARAFEIASEYDSAILCRPFINVSVGIKGDPHVRKAKIHQGKCTRCGACVAVCEQQAIVKSEHYEVNCVRCIGCGKCEDVCREAAVDYDFKKVDFGDVIPRCMEVGAETLELHAVSDDEEGVRRDWVSLERFCPGNCISMCLDRSKLSNEMLIERIRWAKGVVGERMIVQADGAPMSGSGDDYNTTLQAIAIADVIQKERMGVKLLLSGGTNSKTGELARFCGIRPDGISIGTYARNLIRSELEDVDLEKNKVLMNRAVLKARKLVSISLSNISRNANG